MAEVAGCLNWLVNNTLPDLAYHVNAISQGVSKKTTNGWKLVKWLLQYLSGSPAKGLWIRKVAGLPQQLPFCYVDASWDAVSIGGYLIYAFNTLVCWKCQKIKSICRSSFESEIITMSQAAATLTWYVRVVTALVGYDPGPIEMYCDNQGSIDSAGNSRQSSRTRHITQHDLFVRQAVINKTVKCVKVPSAENWADLMTKPLGPDEFVRQIERLQMEPPAHVWTKSDCAKEEL